MDTLIQFNLVITKSEWSLLVSLFLMECGVQFLLSQSFCVHCPNYLVRFLLCQFKRISSKSFEIVRPIAMWNTFEFYYLFFNFWPAYKAYCILLHIFEVDLFIFLTSFFAEALAVMWALVFGIYNKSCCNIFFSKI